MGITGTATVPKTAERERSGSGRVWAAWAAQGLALVATAAGAQWAVVPQAETAAPATAGTASPAGSASPATSNAAPAPRATSSRANGAASGRTTERPRPFTFVPALSVGLAQTDNLTLAAANPESQTVLEAIPTFTLAREGRRFDANAVYRVEGYRYLQRRDSRVANDFDGAFSLALDPDNFFLDFGANRTQTVRDPREPIPRSNLPISNNLVDRDEYYAGPRLQYRLGSNATVQASYRDSWIRYKRGPSTVTPGNADLENGATSFSVDNYARGRGFTWAAQYNLSRTNYQLYPDFKYARAGGELGFWIGPRARLFASGGRESAWDRPTDATLSDPFWEAGFALESGGRLRAEFAAGKRTFGSSRRGSLTYTLRHGRTQLTYSETPTTQGQSGYSGLLQPAPPDLLTEPGSARRYIAKRLDWTWTMNMRRSGFALSVFNESRTEQTLADGTPLPDESQSGGNLSMFWRAGPRTQLLVGGTRERRELSAGDVRDYSSASIGANRDLGARTRVTIEYEHSRERGQGVTGDDYRANLVSILLTRTFAGHPDAASGNR